MIKAWEEGIPQMSKGQICKMDCSPDYAYGAQGYPPLIPSNCDLSFEIELIDFR